MEITPLDIRNQKFGIKKFGGFDPEEVQAFLNQIATTLEELMYERADLLKTINNDKKTVDDYRVLEKTLNNAVITMQKALEDTKERADKEADLIIAEAKVKAEKEVDIIRNNANKLRAEIDSLKQMQANYFARLRNLMRTQEDLLNNIENENSF